MILVQHRTLLLGEIGMVQMGAHARLMSQVGDAAACSTLKHIEKQRLQTLANSCKLLQTKV